MRVIVNSGHVGHAPPHECENGLPTVPYEAPGRMDAIRAALTARGGFTFEEAPALDESIAFAIHDPAYVAFLRETSAELAKARAGAPKIAMPSVFPYGPTPPRRRG